MKKRANLDFVSSISVVFVSKQMQTKNRGKLHDLNSSFGDRRNLAMFAENLVFLVKNFSILEEMLMQNITELPLLLRLCLGRGVRSANGMSFDWDGKVIELVAGESLLLTLETLDHVLLPPRVHPLQTWSF